MAIKTARRRNSRSTVRVARRSTAPKAPGSLNTEARTVRAVIATDAPVPIYDDMGNGEYGYIDEVLLPSGMVEPPKMPLRLDHDVYQSRGVIGRVFDFEVGASEISATLKFSAASDVEMIWQRVAEGHLDSVSIGATYRMRDTTTLQPGQTGRFGGQKYTATDKPMRIVQKWNGIETSVVAEGADPRAVIRSKIRTARNGQQEFAKPGKGADLPRSDKMTKKLKPRGQVARTKGPASTGGNTQRRAARQAVRAVVATNNVDGSDDDDDDIDDTDAERSPRRRRTTQTTQPREAVRDALAAADRRATAAAGSSATPDQIQAARLEERTRVGRIRELGQGHPEEFVSRAINDGLTIEQFGLAALERLRGQSAGHRTSQSGDGVNRAPAVHSVRGASVQGLQAAVLMRAGFSLQNPRLGTESARVLLERAGCGWLADFNSEIGSEGNSELERYLDVGRRFSSDSAARTCERILDLKGKRHHDDVEEIVTRAFSSPYLPRVFGALVSVGLIQGYTEFADSTIGWTTEADWADFRLNQPIGLDATQGLTRHTRGTTAKDVDFADFGEAYAVSRYTGRFALDEMDIIDDTVGANQVMPRQMGDMAARLRPDLVVAVLQANANLGDGVPLFHASRGNLVTGNALSLDNLSNAESAMAAQTVKNKSGVPRPMNMTAGFLIVPRKLRPLGKQIVNSTNVVHGNATQTGNVNPHAGEYQLRSDARYDVGVIDPRTNTKLSGSNSTWYIAEQSGTQAVQVGFRRGTGRMPSFRVRPLTGAGEFGLGWDIAHDVGVGVLKAAALVSCRA